MKTKRDQVYIALKDNFSDIDKMLRILNTDHIDFLMFNRHHREQVDDDAIYNRFDKYKKAGKVRFSGLTTHNDVKGCVASALKTGFYKLLMPAFNQPAFESMTEELRIAEKKKVGFMGMKTMKGAETDGIQIAYFKKLAAHTTITTVNKGFSTFDAMDKFLGVVKESLTFEEDMSLYRYARQNRSHNCMMCGECQRACPRDVEISTLLRASQYYHGQQHRNDLAAEVYSQVPVSRRPTATCHDCRKCESVCPNGISIVSELTKAQRFFQSLLV